MEGEMNPEELELLMTPNSFVMGPSLPSENVNEEQVVNNDVGTEDVNNEHDDVDINNDNIVNSEGIYNEDVNYGLIDANIQGVNVDDDDSEEDSTFEKNKKRAVTVKKTLTCEICNRELDRWYFKQHLVIHTGEKKFKCNVCGKAFNRNAHLKSHLVVHTGSKDHKCNICRKGFRRKSDLKLHMISHTGKKDFKCEICGKEFPQKTSLNKHIVVHTGEKNYKCEVCDKCFSQKSHLSDHMVLHTGKRDFKCEVCGKCFCRRSALTQHMACHLGEKNIVCPICGRRFARQSYLTKHLRLHQGKKSQVESINDGNSKMCQLYIRDDNSSFIKPDTSQPSSSSWNARGAVKEEKYSESDNMYPGYFVNVEEDQHIIIKEEEQDFDG